MVAITAVNRAPRSGPVADMTASLSTLGDGVATSGWRSGQLSGGGRPLSGGGGRRSGNRDRPVSPAQPRSTEG
jgi:hypothetical protein